MSWAILWGGVAFFFGGVITVAQILGSLTGRFTVLGCLVFLALTAALIYMVMVFVIVPFLRF